jgi:hypothetical protein
VRDRERISPLKIGNFSFVRIETVEQNTDKDDIEKYS